MRNRAILVSLAVVLALALAAITVPATASRPAAQGLHWKTFVQFNGAKLQGCVERPAGSDDRTMHFRHDTRQANVPTRVKVTENFGGGIIGIIFRDAMTRPGHLVTSARIGFVGEEHRFKGTIITASGATHSAYLKIAFFPTC